MQTISFSEFTFGFAFLCEEIARDPDNISHSPILPNLRQETLMVPPEDSRYYLGYGYDAFLPKRGANYFYQFKMSEYLQRRDANCVHQSFSVPCYRFSLYKKGDYLQHERLKQLSERFENTLYVSPAIPNDEEFELALMNRNIISHSVGIELTNCNPVQRNDTQQHYIAFDFDQGVFNKCSDEKTPLHKVITWKKYPDDTSDENRKIVPLQEIDHKYFITLYGDLKSIVQKCEELYPSKNGEKVLEYFNFDSEEQRDKEILWRIWKVLAGYFNVTMVLVGEPRNSQKKTNKLI
jgi:hypothetical protein